MTPSDTASKSKGFITLERNHTVTQVAELFNCEATQYLELLHDHGAWYAELSDITAVIRKGSDVPVPQLVGEGDTLESKGVGTQDLDIKGVNAEGDTHDLDIKGVHDKLDTQNLDIKGVDDETVTHSQSGDLDGECEDELSQPSKKRQKTRQTLVPSGIRSIKRSDIEISEGVRKSARLRQIDQAILTIESEVQEMNSLRLQQAMTKNIDEMEHGSSQVPDLKGYKKAHTGPHAKHWAAAEEKEWKGIWEK